MNELPDKLATEVRRQHEHVQITAISSKESGYIRTTHPDAQWYASASLGLFFHWGISSVSGQGDLSWSMMKRPEGFVRRHAEAHGIYAVQSLMCPDQYWKQAEQFLCENYDPDQWLVAAKEAGVEYVVLTTKHHDGFCLWPSEFGEFSTKNYLGGRDLVGEFVAAARKNGLRVGFYYSPPDWHFFREYKSFNYGANSPRLGQNWQATEPPVLCQEEQGELDAAYAVHCRGQLHELLTRYGTVDIMWFDGRMPEGSMSMEQVRALQPSILINPRGYGVGDFDTPECQFPEERPEAGWWEYCHLLADGAWGYLDHEVYKPLGWLLEEWGKTRCWGGKFLPNVAPDSHGQMPHGYYLRMQQLQEWRLHSGDSMLGTLRGGAWPESSNVPFSFSGQKIYVYVDWLWEGDVVLQCLPKKPKTVFLMRTGDFIEYHYVGGELRFKIPHMLRTNKTDVVVIISE
jgi:alpha-L-fucosidase